jgi:integrase
MNAQLIPFHAPDDGELTVAQVIDLYLQDLALRVQAGEYTPAAQRNAERYLRSFAAACGNLPVSRCRQMDLTRWLTLKASWKSNATKRDALGHVLACFNWAADPVGGGLVPHPVYRRPRNLRLTAQPRGPMEPEQYAAVMRSAHRNRYRKGSQPLRRALYFLRHTGARTCEMRNLEWAEIDLEGGICRLVKHKTAHVTGEARLIALEPNVLRLLLNLHARRPIGSKRVFLNADGQGWTKDSFGRHFRRYADLAKLPASVKPYCLRHAFVCGAIEAGMGERAIADLTGHKDTRMISYYGRQTRSKLEHLRQSAAAALKRRKKPEVYTKASREKLPLFDLGEADDPQKPEKQ